MTRGEESVRPWDGQHFRATLGHFCSGITVVAAEIDGVPTGLTCQSFFSVSVDPPLVAFSVSRASTSFPAIQMHGSCSVNVLAESQQSISEAFARSGADKWSDVSWRPGPVLGHPIIDEVIAWLECRFESVTEAGDHLLVLARVDELWFSEYEILPLLYFRGKYNGVQIRSGEQERPSDRVDEKVGHVVYQA